MSSRRTTPTCAGCRSEAPLWSLDPLEMQTRGQKIIIGGTIVLLLFGVLGYFGFRWGSVQYHSSKMTRAYGQVLKAPHENSSPAKQLYEKHRAELISLGYFVKQQFYLKRISAHSGEFRQLLRKL